LQDPLKERDPVPLNRDVGTSGADCPHVVGAVAGDPLFGEVD